MLPAYNYSTSVYSGSTSTGAQTITLYAPQIACWHNKFEDRSIWRFGSHPKPAAVTFNNRTADRKAHSKALWFGAKKGPKNLFGLTRGHSRTRIVDLYQYALRIFLRPDQQFPGPVGD